MIDTYLGYLETMFGANVRNYFTGDFLVQNWKKEPYIKGSFSMYHDGYSTPIRQLRQSRGPSQQLWFAGEAIPRGNWQWGFAHGAALSERRAANEIMNLYANRRRWLDWTKNGNVTINDDDEQ